MKKYLFIAGVSVLALVLASCKKNEKADPLNISEVAPPPKVPTDDEMVKEAQSKPITSLALSENHFDFGKIKKGDVVEHKYEVSNTGDNPLIISQVKPGCGCTAPDYTKDPILPGKKGYITLKFDSGHFEGQVQKQAKVYANTEKAPITISFEAEIENK